MIENEKQPIPENSETQETTESSARESDVVSEGKEPPKIKKAKKKNRALRVTIIVICSLLALALVLVGAVYGVFRYYYGMLDYDELFSDDESWVSETIEDDEGIDDSIDSSKLATDEEKDKFLGQIEDVENADKENGGGLNIDIKELGGNLGKIERNYTCEYISERDDVINILLIGLDSRYNTNSGLSDVMMVVSICPSDKKIVLTSFLRDVYVAIPGYGGNRLNVAYAAGGPSLLVETIEKNFGLRIDRYATSNFYAFVDVVDYIGKIRVYLSDAELGVINEHIYWTNNVIHKTNDRTKDAIENKGAGYYELNGIQALAYARIRKLDSDFGRTNRQRNVMTAVFDRVKQMSPAEWNSLLTKILPMIKTNLSESDILKIMLNIGAYMKYDIESISMPPSDHFRYMQIDGRSVIGVDQEYIKSYLKEKIYG